ncbi:Guanylate kinase [Orchesella cincta]|uniref:guanylate kinase n=1 Tax=Orchesella cincta TaxID=48709 RepID=A0A1D2NMG1_ORCCI|nr:Guanylate kinase [Orchesella cincta]
MSIRSLLRPLVLCGPSGSGKSTFIKRLMEENLGIFGFSTSHTTRLPRDGEQNGREYHFVTRDQFQAAITNSEFIEWAEFSGNMYGTSKASVSACQDAGQICILDIDCQGVKQIKTTDLNPRLVFIKPPSIEVLKERLVKRGTETESSLQKRLSAAQEELNYGEEPGSFHIVITNDNFETAYNELAKFLEDDLKEIKKIKAGSGDI